MADVFISYAREDRATAQGLADFLEAKGIEVWWDAEILGSDDFYEVILAALSKAKAAIVIWTKTSAKSRFVRDEARYALHKDKLIATKAPDLDVMEIPFGFQGQHTDDIAERDRILMAVEKLGVEPKIKSPSPVQQDTAPMDDWNAVKSTTRAEDLLDYLGTHPNSPMRAACLDRLRELTTGSAPTPKAPSTVSTGPSKLRAFFSGFSFRLPGFQSLTKGTYAAIGGAVFYIILAIAAPAIVVTSMDAKPYGFITLGIVCLLVTLLGLQRFWAWRGQRNFIAAIITALATSAIAGIMVWSLSVAVGFTKEEAVWLIPTTALAMMIFLSIALYRAR